MSDKKISELDIVSPIDHSKDYVLAIRDGKNYRVRIGEIIDESKVEVPAKLSELINDTGFIVNIPGEYITESELSDKGYLTEHQDLTDYAKKSDISDEVSKIIADGNFITSIPDEYITEDELEDKGYLTEHQDLSDYAKKADIPTVPTEVSAFNNDANYATESYVDSAISDAQLGGEEVDLTGYAKKDEIPTKVSQLTNDSGFITSVPSEYVTDSELTAKGYLTTIPGEYVTDSELTAKSYATQSYVDQKINEAELNGSDIELNYSTTIPKAAGTASTGSENAVSRGDHIHPVQTSVSGNAGTATKLATARSINDTSFDGSADITTNKWGTARTLTIGNKGQSVDGSSNVSWSLSDIGAAASSHSHTEYAASSHTHDYLPLSGGTLTGGLTIGSSSSAKNFQVYGTALADTIIAAEDLYVSALQQWEVLHEGNYETYVPKSSESDYYDTYVWSDSDGRANIAQTLVFHNGIYDENGDSPKLGGGCTEMDGSPSANILYVYANLTPWTIDYFDLGDSSFSWYYCYAYGGVISGSDRTMKENINYIRNNEVSTLSLEDDNGSDGITYSDMYNFIKEDLELATYNFKDKPEEDVQMNFIAQDLLYNLDGTDNKVGQFIVKPKTSLTEEEAEAEIKKIETKFNRELNDDEKDRISSPKLDYDRTNFTSVLAGALKQAINEIELLKEEIQELKSKLDN